MEKSQVPIIRVY